MRFQREHYQHYQAWTVLLSTKSIQKSYIILVLLLLTLSLTIYSSQPTTTLLTNSTNPQPKSCTHSDAISLSSSWNKNWKFHFVHIPKTMGTTIYSQLPSDYVERFYGRTSIEDYEHDHQVVLHQYSPSISWWDRFRTIINPKNSRTSIQSLDHLKLDQLVDLGLLRCSDIDRIEVTAIIREPFSWFISHCHHYHRTLDQEITWLRKVSDSSQKTGYQSTEWMDFEYDWNMTVFTMESTDQIRDWFRRFGIDMRFDDEHHFNRRESSGFRARRCEMSELTEEQRTFIRDRLADDFRIYEAAKRNNGSIRMRHHLQVIDH